MAETAAKAPNRAAKIVRTMLATAGAVALAGIVSVAAFFGVKPQERALARAAVSQQIDGTMFGDFQFDDILYSKADVDTLLERIKFLSEVDPTVGLTNGTIYIHGKVLHPLSVEADPHSGITNGTIYIHGKTIKPVRTVNHTPPDDNGNVDVQGGGGDDIYVHTNHEGKVTIKGTVKIGYGGSATGNYSFSSGSGTAEGGNSHAEGNSTAKGTYSHAEGYFTTAEGYASHSEGSQTSATAMYSHAEGEKTKALAQYSHAEGCQTEVQTNAKYSHAEGYQTKTDAEYSHVEGSMTTIDGQSYVSHAEGWKNTMKGSWYSHAEGYNNLLVGANGLGYYLHYAHAEGQNNVISNAPNSESTASHVEGTANTIVGAYSAHVEGRGNKISQTSSAANRKPSYSHTEGWRNKLIGGALYCHAEGQENTITNTFEQGCSHVEGHNNTIICSDYAHSEGGKNTIEHSFYCHAEGYQNKVQQSDNASLTSGSKYSHAEGSNNTLGAHNSHIEGMGNKISLDTTMTGMGAATMANLGGAHAEGIYTTVEGGGMGAHSEGGRTYASGAFSKVGGVQCMATNNYTYVWNGTAATDYSDIKLQNIYKYGSHGVGTFNVNPQGGISGFWIGEKTLEQHIRDIVTGMRSSPDLSVLEPKVVKTITVYLDANGNQIKRVEEMTYESQDGE